MVESEKEREKGLSQDSDKNDGNEGKRNGERNEHSTRKDWSKDTCGEERGRDIISEARTLIAPSFCSPAFRNPSRSLIPLVLWRSRTASYSPHFSFTFRSSGPSREHACKYTYECASGAHVCTERPSHLSV